MQTHADKNQENKSRSVAAQARNEQKQNAATFQFVDNRPEAIAQRKLKEMANNSSGVAQLRAFQNMANNHSIQQKRSIQTKDKTNTEEGADLKFRDAEDTNSSEKEKQEEVAPSFSLLKKTEDKKELPAGLRKKMAHSWVQQQINSQFINPFGFKNVLTEAQNSFGLDKIEIEEAEEKNLSIRYYASPGDLFSLVLNKPIGNNLSDLAIGVGGRFWSAIVGNREEVDKAKPVYGPLTGRGMGTFMQINGLTTANMPVGTATDSDELEDSNSLYKTLKKRRLPGTSTTYYVAGHLLRGKLGGSGSDWKNLSPITQSTNNYSSASHLHQAEDEVHGLVGTTPITYRVQAIYGRWPWEWPSYFSHLIRYGGTKDLNDVLAAEDHIPTGFSCQWWVQGGTGSWIPYSRFIRQWRFENGESYVVKVASGKDVDFADETEVWDYLQIPIKIAIGALLWSTFPMLPTLLSSPHLMRGLAANALTDYLGRATDFVNSSEGGTRIAARRAEIGAFTTGLSYFGVPQIALLDPLITMAVGNVSGMAIKNGFEIEAITSEALESTIRVSGLLDWLNEPQILKGVAAGVIDISNNPAVRHGIKKTVGAATNRCTAKTASGSRCKNKACDAAKKSGKRLCNIHNE